MTLSLEELKTLQRVLRFYLNLGWFKSTTEVIESKEGMLAHKIAVEIMRREDKIIEK